MKLDICSFFIFLFKFTVFFACFCVRTYILNSFTHYTYEYTYIRCLCIDTHFILRILTLSGVTSIFSL